MPSQDSALFKKVNQLSIMYMIIDCLVSLLGCKLHVDKKSIRFAYDYIPIPKLMVYMQGVLSNYLLSE